jgi:hypothetical protein
VVIQGKVTTTAFYDSAYIQDDTGGIVAFSEVPDGSLQLGDTVRVYGHIGSFENDKELLFDRFNNSIVKISSGPPVEPKLLSTAESVSEENQGLLVQVEGKVQSIPDDSTYMVDDGSGVVTVFLDGYISNKTGAPPEIKVGDTLQATGLSGEYSKGDRIRVRDTKELVVVTGTDPATPVTGVTLDKSALNLKIGETEQLTATVAPDTATNKAVTWISSDESVAMVDSNGMVTAVSAGTATITVTTEDGGFTAQSTVMVTDDSSGGVIPVTGVTLDKVTLNLKVGGTEQLTASVHPDMATNKDVTWTSSNPGVATVDSNGKVKAISAGTATITVRTIDGDFIAISTVTVTSSNSGGNNDNNGNNGNNDNNGNNGNNNGNNGNSGNKQ